VTYFLVSATIIFVLLSLIWTTKDWTNYFIKFLFILHAFVGAYLIIKTDLLSFLL